MKGDRAAGLVPVTLVSAGVLMLVLVIVFTPGCFDIPFFSVECLGPYLPIAIPLTAQATLTNQNRLTIFGSDQPKNWK